MLVAFCVKAARRTPIAMTLLLIFIVAFSYLISLSCSAVVESVGQDEPVVPIAIAATVGIALGLSVYAWLCKGNFSAWIGILMVCCMTSLIIGISMIFVRNETMLLVFCGLGVIIYGIYLVILTKLIIGDKMGGFPLDSAIIASVFLYIYIIRMFLYILVILGRARRWFHTQISYHAFCVDLPAHTFVLIKFWCRLIIWLLFKFYCDFIKWQKS